MTRYRRFELEFVCWGPPQHLVIIQPTGKLLIDDVCIDAAEDRLELLGDKLPSQFGRVRSP